MAPPWVIFDNIAWYDGDCANGSEPDIAGIGVVLSFVLASAMTTAASILAMILDNAYDSKGQFALSAPMKYIRERFLDTGWKKDYAWRPFLDPLIIGFGDQQLVTGYAVLLSAWIKVAQNSFEVQGAHFVLVLYICALSSSSHLAALITLRKYFRKYKLIAKIRLTLVVFFATCLFASMLAAIGMPPTVTSREGVTTEESDRAQRLAFLVPMLFILIETTYSFRSAHFMLLPAHFGLRLVYFLFLNPLIAFAVQILLAILSVVLVLTQKFAQPDNQKAFCGLQDEGENVWGFGQTLSVAMLLLPVLSACHTYLEGRQDIREG
ncbi:pre-rRNA-processing protein esf1 [Didymella glomerata]|uniref:Pre-rRNA-processing protein esf1 n=1 Tax=Didymella glomerata TaxID=749621 RepID=A0A9W9BV17_9PLEO|nr:pre-rRNA-processing protein esf1 [Didymella glomerata]